MSLIYWFTRSRFSRVDSLCHSTDKRTPQWRRRGGSSGGYSCITKNPWASWNIYFPVWTSRMSVVGANPQHIAVLRDGSKARRDLRYTNIRRCGYRLIDPEWRSIRFAARWRTFVGRDWIAGRWGRSGWRLGTSSQRWLGWLDDPWEWGGARVGTILRLGVGWESHKCRGGNDRVEVDE